ncbi:MAG: M48 family metallopeptidase [Planctomycetia bacterium]|nr:M48 family metallopeptidase [Planctomycetia bacterium]
MPILLVFVLIAACLPIEWPAPPVDPPREVAASLTGCAVVLALLAAMTLRTWVVRTLQRDPDSRFEVAHVYGCWRRVLFFVNVGVTAGCVLGLGWGWLTRRELLVFWRGEARLAPFAELLVPLPYFALLFGCWLIYFDAERELHRALYKDDRPFWSRLAYILHNLRQFALLVLLPVALIATQQTLSRFAPETTRSDAYRAASLTVVPVMILFLPLVMKPLLGLQSMPAGPVRDRLEALAKRLNFRCTDFLLWPTHGAVANAMIVGLLPRVRFVVFTDRILEELPPEEVDAVFGHEVGHAKHGHIWLYAGFLTLSLSVLAALLLLVGQQLDAAMPVPTEYATWLGLVPVTLLGAYMFVVFGLLSRRCERQADVFGCKAVSCINPACVCHDEKTIYAKGGASLCPTGIRTFTRALERVAQINGFGGPQPEKQFTLGELLRGAWAWMRAWQHSPMPRRVAFLYTLLDSPTDEPRFQRRLAVFKWVLMLILAGALVALGQSVGWKELFDAM